MKLIVSTQADGTKAKITDEHGRTVANILNLEISIDPDGASVIATLPGRQFQPASNDPERVWLSPAELDAAEWTFEGPLLTTGIVRVKPSRDHGWKRIRP